LDYSRHFSIFYLQKDIRVETDFQDISELENDLKIPGITPNEVMEKSFYGTHNRNWKSYLKSIEWDTWCKPLDAKSLLEIVREREIKSHPFNQFF